MEARGDTMSKLSRVTGPVILLLLVGGGLALAFAPHRPSYAAVEAMRAEQDVQGTRDEHVRQRFFRLYTENPNNPMYIYLWSRCVDEPAKRLELAEQGIRADPTFSWNYNMASRALAQLNRLPEAFDRAAKGAALDPGNLELAEKHRSLKLAIDRKLFDQPKPAPNAYTRYESKENFDKGAVRYQGFFRELIRSPDHSDIRAMERTRLSTAKDSASDEVRGFVVCANPYADSCVHVYVTRDPIVDPGDSKVIWQRPSADVAALKQDQLVAVAGSVVTNGRGENILLADGVTVEPE
jgi:hypothetical protein